MTIATHSEIKMFTIKHANQLFCYWLVENISTYVIYVYQLLGLS